MDKLSHDLLSQLSEKIAAQIGLHFPPERWPDLERGIRAAAPKLGHPDAASCARWVLSAPLTRRGTEILAGELTVGETYFFREKHSFDILAEKVLPELLRAREGTGRHLRIWSAGCCTGEEPYSIAILLDRVLPEWQVTLLATDLNPLALEKAEAGVYSEWSFRDAPPWLKGNYFTSAGRNHFAIAPRIKEKVTFAYLNLAEETYPSPATHTEAMDLIFCRNVLMYFSAERVRKVVGRLRQSLVEGGWFLVSPAECSADISSQFRQVYFDGVPFYRKQAVAARAPVERFEPEVVPESSIIRLPELRLPELPSPVQPKTPHEEALALFERKNYAEAAEKLQGGPESSAEDAALLARIWANRGDLVQARSWAEQGLRADKLNVGLHYLLAVILEEQGAVEESLLALKNVIYLDPDFVLAHFALGNGVLRQGRDEEAHRSFANVLNLLAGYRADEVLPHSEGLAAGRLREMVESARSREKAA